jgi:DNA-directed RNA polymerase subunit RPC12/RpoP
MNCFKCNKSFLVEKAGWCKCPKCGYKMFIPKGAKATKQTQGSLEEVKKGK